MVLKMTGVQRWFRARMFFLTDRGYRYIFYVPPGAVWGAGQEGKLYASLLQQFGS